MLKLNPVLKDYIWGGRKLKDIFGRDNGGKLISESWEVSVHADGPSMYSGGTLADYITNNPQSVSARGGEFPVLIKYIDAAQNLSVQVHPNDEYAKRVEGDNGKTEMWYIVKADEGAGIYCGFKRDTGKEEFLQKVQDGTVEELLNFIPVHEGDCFLIEAGTVHAIGAGCVICEVQQSSNVTYRVYDYNRRDAAGNLRPLHIEKASDVINFREFADNTGSGAFETVEGGKIRLLTDCKYFTCHELLLGGEYSETCENSFAALNVIEGSGTINGESFKCGDSFFIPCGESFTLCGNGKIIITGRHETKYYAGIDLGGTFIKCGIVSDRGKILIKDKIPTGKERPYDEIAQDMAELVRTLAAKVGLSTEKLDGAGIGSPGFINSERGIIVYSNNFDWHDVPLVASLESKLDMPVSITNDANAAALGENFCGAGKAYRSMVLVTLGTGVGGGIILDGKLYEGGYSAGAEIGHEVIRVDGEKCTCGRKGCLEAYASATALIRRAKRAMSKNPDSKLWELCGGDINGIDGKMIFDALGCGDKTAKRVIKDYVKYLAAGIVNIANVFRPEAILLGGGISAAGDALMIPLYKEFESGVFGGNESAPVKLKLATLGNDAGICGAARLAMEKR